MQNAKEYYYKYLKENIDDSDTLERMKNVITEFKARAPRLIVTKCIDGRVHGSKAKGYPPTSVKYGRTDGNNVSLNRSNFWFWNRIDRVVNDAKCNTPGMPAMFISYMHRSDKGFGCAAHNNNEKNAMNSIVTQAKEVRKTYKRSDLYVICGITNTDNMAETLIFEDGNKIDTEEIIQKSNLSVPHEVFTENFLKNVIDDVATARYVKNLTPEELLNGDSPQIFNNLETSLSMESYLIRIITARMRRDRTTLKKLINPVIVDNIFDILDKSKIPDLLVGPIFYQNIWNIAYSLSLRNRIKKMNEEELEKQLNHSEELVCYGEGFEILLRNKAVLVKTGRGDDVNALTVAKHVIEHNREKFPQNHPPLVHINIEIFGVQIVWDDFNDSVSSRIRTMLRNVDHVFGESVGILTTYSYRDQKRFFPIKIEEDQRLVFPINIIQNLNTENNFSNLRLKSSEGLYTADFFKKS